ncbi:hypothetical protein NKG05_10770 [Oerskovia sp. M15]
MASRRLRAAGEPGPGVPTVPARPVDDFAAPCPTWHPVPRARIRRDRPRDHRVLPRQHDRIAEVAVVLTDAAAASRTSGARS